ncbi:hypothetical protein REH65_30845 [Saccharopolyspora sp. ID03-671]|uniref:hypothetical protein n=1 Tax=Saccharopolyspora sp. ID03-671 TaxID=3073066 RepID=UPI0032475852
MFSCARGRGRGPRTFARFVEHARACAEAAEVDAVLVGSHTARTQLDGWAWKPIEDLELAMNTWLVHRTDARDVVPPTIAAIKTSAARPHFEATPPA